MGTLFRSESLPTPIHGEPPRSPSENLPRACRTGQCRTTLPGRTAGPDRRQHLYSILAVPRRTGRSPTAPRIGRAAPRTVKDQHQPAASEGTASRALRRTGAAARRHLGRALAALALSGLTPLAPPRTRLGRRPPPASEVNHGPHSPSPSSATTLSMDNARPWCVSAGRANWSGSIKLDTSDSL